MLERLDVALADPESGERLAQRLREQFPVAMIDEFQDTSPLQFRIFDRIYRTAENLPDSALLLIGDPKQSIYGFRGADIHSYLAARRATAGRHHVLGTNFRSTQAVVEVVNRWFDMAPDAFGYKQGGEDPLPFQPVGAKGRDEVFKTSAGDVQAMTVVHDATLRSTRDAQTHLSALCAEQIVAWLSDPQARFADAQKGEKPLQPKDATRCGCVAWPRCIYQTATRCLPATKRRTCAFGCAAWPSRKTCAACAPHWARARWACPWLSCTTWPRKMNCWTPAASKCGS
jgi:exodeoxyribonuclease V beta subunit